MQAQAKECQEQLTAQEEAIRESTVLLRTGFWISHFQHCGIPQIKLYQGETILFCILHMLPWAVRILDHCERRRGQRDQAHTGSRASTELDTWDANNLIEDPDLSPVRQLIR